MRWQVVGCRMVVLLVLLGLVLQAAYYFNLMPLAVAQQGGGNNNNNQNNQNNTSVAGVTVDAQGVLRRQTFVDPGGRLRLERMAAARAALSPDVLAPSKLRKVSLNKLEQAIQAANGVLTEEMRHLAGLQRVRYVFCYPESKDIVIAGPAEGWLTDPSGRVVGMNNGRPVVQLQDLVVALRAFPPNGEATSLIGCSIDPTQEGLQAMQGFLAGVGSYATPAQTQYIVTGLQSSLGMQTVSVNGVSPSTRFAQVMVEADYRMKLIGIGLESPPVRLVSFIEKADPAQVSRNALFRWFFTPDYQCVRVTEDGLGMELVGDGVKLVGEDEMVTGEGDRRIAARGNRASQVFVSSFTKKYSELADRSPVYAELRNLIDLAIAAAYIQHEDLYAKTGWSMEFFGDEKSFAVELYHAPKQVASTVAAIWKGNRLMTPIGGGVHIDATQAIDSENLLKDENGDVAKLRGQTSVELAKGQWWWD
ncbi:MAG: DUF1598 domain-containing protein [Pirellulales bacterium]|nr:DUF1598 domain-containing protein [Pirellulales bacterium]